MPHQLLRILAEVHERPWAITERSMETILGVLERSPIDLEAVAARLGRPLENTGGRVEQRGSVAVLNIEGPLFRKANLLTEISGATSVQNAMFDFTAALEDPAVAHIVLNIASPGGQVDGINDFADAIRAGAATKPVTAFVDGLAASGGYWLAAAAPHVVAGESSFLGSIGIVATVTDNRDAQERQGVKRYEIVSSQSPLKRVDVRTEEGRQQILETVDALAALFIGKVAGFRETTAENVQQNFGRGNILPARRAIEAGMADEVGSFEGLITRLNAGAASGTLRLAASKGEPMSQPNPNPPAQPAASADTGTATTPIVAGTIVPGTIVVSAASERARIQGILNCEEARGREPLARTLALETNLDVEVARKILASTAAAAPAAPTNRLEAAMTQVPNPKVGVAAEQQDEDSPEAEARRILAFVPAHQKRVAS